MRLVVALTGLGLALAGCMTPGEEEVPTREDSRYACNAAQVQNMVGQIATQAGAAAALRTSNARTMRWISPGVAVTMDYRSDRLNIHLDSQNRITRIVCG